VLGAISVLIGIFFFPRIELGSGAKIRLEDIVSIGILILLVFKLYRKQLVIRRESVLPLIYFFYGFFLSLARVLAGQERHGFLFVIFWSKEFQYFLFFLLFYYLFAAGHTRAAAAVILGLIIANAAAGIFNMAMGVPSGYGIGAQFVENSPSLSGQVYFGAMLMSAFLLFFDLVRTRRERAILYALIVISLVNCLATGSKSTSFASLIFLTALYAVRDCPVPRKASMLCAGRRWAVLIAGGVILVFLYHHVFGGRFLGLDLRRLRNPIESTVLRYRYDIAPKFAAIKGPGELIAGAGYLAGQSNMDRVWFTTAYDSQYARNLLVLGITGTAIWFFMLFGFAWSLRPNRRALVFYIALLAAYLSMGIGLESFVTSKSGPIFWIMTGMLVGIRRTSHIKMPEFSIDLRRFVKRKGDHMTARQNISEAYGKLFDTINFLALEGKYELALEVAQSGLERICLEKEAMTVTERPDADTYDKLEKELTAKYVEIRSKIKNRGNPYLKTFFISLIASSVVGVFMIITTGIMMLQVKSVLSSPVDKSVIVLREALRSELPRITETVVNEILQVSGVIKRQIPEAMNAAVSDLDARVNAAIERRIERRKH